MFHVNHIWGGLAPENPVRSRKNLARQARHEPNSVEVNLTNQSQWSIRRDRSIIFSKDNAKGVYDPYCDALIVTLSIVDKCLYQILINTGSSTDILFLSTFA